MAPEGARRVAPWSLYSVRQRWAFLTVLFLVSASNYFDRNVISVVLEPIKSEFRVSDTMLGFLSGFSFAIFHALFGIPVARWADRGNRRTLMTLALVIWSAMTMLCGLAQNFWHLVLARVGVGAGESGAIPPAQSLLIDYFPPERRATALAIFSAASTAGYLLAFGVGGFVAATYGWRIAFLVAGAPGLILAIVVRLSLSEPRLDHRLELASRDTESIKEAIRKLWLKRSYVYGLLGCLTLLLLAFGGLIFIPSFLIRVLGATLREASVTYGLVAAAGSVIGTLSGGWLADRLARRDVRWLAWIPAIACLLTGVLFELAFSTDRFVEFMAFAFAANGVMVGGIPVAWAAIHAVCGSARRAMAVAIVLFSTTLLGTGFGPILTGALSDMFSATNGPGGLRYALMVVTTLLLPSAIFFYAFGRTMVRDLEG